MQKIVHIPKEILYDLYVNKRLSSLKIAEMLKSVNARTIRKKLKKYGIPRRTLSEALVKKKRVSFSDNLEEKAYLLGLRAGDFWARKKNHSIRVQTSTTHPAQIELLRNSLSKYGDICVYYYKNKQRLDEWFIYVDLDKSFEFLVEKPQKILSWILENDVYFYQFLTAYMDCEGCFKIFKSHQHFVRFTFALKTCDKIILEQIQQKLETLNYFVSMYLEKQKGQSCNGFGKKYNFNFYNLTIYQKKDIIQLIKLLLPLSRHPEKITKMQFIIKHKDSLWYQVSEEWNNIRNKIKKEILKVSQQQASVLNE